MGAHQVEREEKKRGRISKYFFRRISDSSQSSSPPLKDFERGVEFFLQNNYLSRYWCISPLHISITHPFRNFFLVCVFHGGWLTIYTPRYLIRSLDVFFYFELIVVFFKIAANGLELYSEEVIAYMSKPVFVFFFSFVRFIGIPVWKACPFDCYLED